MRHCNASGPAHNNLAGAEAFDAINCSNPTPPEISIALDQIGCKETACT